jgi:hypothetical protein
VLINRQQVNKNSSCSPDISEGEKKLECNLSDILHDYAQELLVKRQNNRVEEVAVADLEVKHGGTCK